MNTKKSCHNVITKVRANEQRKEYFSENIECTFVLYSIRAVGHTIFETTNELFLRGKGGRTNHKSTTACPPPPYAAECLVYSGNSRHNLNMGNSCFKYVRSFCQDQSNYCFVIKFFLFHKIKIDIDWLRTAIFVTIAKTRNYTFLV